MTWNDLPLTEKAKIALLLIAATPIITFISWLWITIILLLPVGE